MQALGLTTMYVPWGVDLALAAEPVVPGNVGAHHAVDVSCFGSLTEQVYPAVCGV